MNQDLERHERLLELVQKAGEAVEKTLAYAMASEIHVPKLATLAITTAEIADEVAVTVSRLSGELH